MNVNTNLPSIVIVYLSRDFDISLLIALAWPLTHALNRCNTTCKLIQQLYEHYGTQITFVQVRERDGTLRCTNIDANNDAGVIVPDGEAFRHDDVDSWRGMEVGLNLGNHPNHGTELSGT